MTDTASKKLPIFYCSASFRMREELEDFTKLLANHAPSYEFRKGRYHEAPSKDIMNAPCPGVCLHFIAMTRADIFPFEWLDSA